MNNRYKLHTAFRKTIGLVMRSNVISGLWLFNQVAAHASFTGAAKQLHLTTGAGSQQVIHLEESLGFTLV
ncbi:LysR family transcriptional regulator, partial [Escherichia coli]|nr:LysR family transcriptional regulator [Escherichia coli]